MNSLSKLFKNCITSNFFILENGTSICNYRKHQKNFFNLQKSNNLSTKTKNKIKNFHWFFFENNIILKKNNFVRINKKKQKLFFKKKKNLHSFVKEIWFQQFDRSNQNTYFLQRPIFFPLYWIQKGDLLSDCSASQNGELTLGHNLFVAYMPWDGFNFEDAVLINEKVLLRYTSLHIQKYDIEIVKDNFETITRQIPGLQEQDLENLNNNGIIKVGSWVRENDILVGKIFEKPPLKKSEKKSDPPLLTYKKLLYDILKAKKTAIHEKSFRVPLGCFGRILRVTYLFQNQDRDLPKKYQKSSPIKNVYRCLKKKPTKILKNKYNLLEFVLSDTYLTNFKKKLSFIDLEYNAIIFRWFWLYNTVFKKVKKKVKKLLKQNSNFNCNLKKKILFKKIKDIGDLKKITIYLAEQKRFQIGDKISGRHGNKGIISQICYNEDMPYCINGQTLDMVLNPLGVPSRMNVGQILECLLGFTGQIFKTKFHVTCFDEMYGYDASRSFVYSKLLELCSKTTYPWLFSKNCPGKVQLFDGRTGQAFSQSATIGSSYIIKLVHIVDEKIHARSTGPYSLVTQQPLKGRSKHGGQRIGEMEVWALQGFGCAYTLQELLTIKSDDLYGRNQILFKLIKNKPFRFGKPESFRVVLRELQSLCLNIKLKT
uniref:DNA-directed RNA polymerase n=1 Tax=Boodleopsis sp. FL1161 TaxID=2364084 RepID=A0A386AZ51_9CHLO|nr:RNA polymerase b-subunit [Boodleopsis sp. FL1161]